MIRAFLTRIAITAPDNLPKSDLTNNTVKNLLNYSFALAGAVALVFIAFAGLKYTISRGDPAAVKSSKETIVYAVVGLLITMTAYGIVNFVFFKVKS